MPVDERKRVGGEGWWGKKNGETALTNRLSSSERELAVLETTNGLESGSELESTDRGRGEERSEGEVSGGGDDGD